MQSTILGIPLNRFVLWVKPYVNLAAAAVAAVIVAKLNVLGVQGLGQDNLATLLTLGGVGAATWLFQQIADLKWVKGHHIELAATVQSLAAIGGLSFRQATAPVDVPPDVGDAGTPHVPDEAPSA